MDDPARAALAPPPRRGLTDEFGTSGDDRLAATSRPLRHGRWQLELRDDEIAAIAYDGVPLLRAIRPVVRDEDWNTLPVRVLSLTPADIDADRETESVRIELLFETGAIRYAATLGLRVDEHALTLDFSGRALAPFDRNRIGLVVLHLPSDAGSAVDVVAADGSVRSSAWPTAISPHQPFVDVQGFRWVRDGVRAELELSGDVFETEDQRNWTDASFKTYSTPLSLPFPEPVAVGDTVDQRAVVRADGRRSSAQPAQNAVVTVSPRVVAKVPGIGLGAFVHPGPSDPRGAPAAADRSGSSAAAGAAPRFASVLLELAEPARDWPRQVELAARQAHDLGGDLDVRIVAGTPALLGQALEMLPLPAVARLAAFDPARHTATPELWQALVENARRRGLDCHLLAGTRAHFAEFNRQFAQVPADAEELTFSITPQMHAVEVPHIVDSLTGQRLVAESAVRLAAGRAVHIGPVTLARRFNAVATSGTPDPATDAVRAVDPLQPTDFAAAWTLGSVAALTVTGVESLTYYETAGPRGIRDDHGNAYPVAGVLERIAAWRGLPVLEAACPPGLAAYAVLTDDGPAVIVANLTGTVVETTVDLDGDRRALSLAPWGVGHLPS